MEIITQEVVINVNGCIYVPLNIDRIDIDRIIVFDIFKIVGTTYLGTFYQLYGRIPATDLEKTTCLKVWCAEVANPQNGLVGYAKQYKRDCIFKSELTPMTFFGCFPVYMTESADIVEFTIAADNMRLLK